MTTSTPILGLILYNSTTDQSAFFSTFRSDWGGTATTSNFYKIDTSIGTILTDVTNLENNKGATFVAAGYISPNYYESSAPTITSYSTGMTILLDLNTDSNGTVTLNINGLGTKSVMKVNNSGAIVNITGAELQSGKYYLFVYDGTRFLWVNANSGDQIYMAGTSGNVVTVNSDNSLLGTSTPSAILDIGYSNTSTSIPNILTNSIPVINGSNDLERISTLKSIENIKTSIYPSLVSTYSLIYTTALAYWGGVLSPNGDIHFIPRNANRGQKISSAGVVSTYSLVYTIANAYFGGVLSQSGEVHFIPASASVGQKVSSAGVVSTYSLAYTTGLGYLGGVVALNGDINMIPYGAAVGQKVSSAGVVSTYSLAYTTTDAYWGGVLSSNGDIHFVPSSTTVGQKISSNGVVSTYSLAYTTTNAYAGGVLAPNGDIHFIPFSASVGQKVSSAGVVSTYSLVYTAGSSSGGIITPNGDIHFIPYSASVGQKITSSGVVSTYSLAYTTANAYQGGILSGNGDIHMIPTSASIGQKINLWEQNNSFPNILLLSPYLNKL